MKILIIMSSMGTGGAEKALVNLLNTLDLNRNSYTLQLIDNKGSNLQYIPHNIQVLSSLREKNIFLQNKKNILKYCLKHFRIFSIFKLFLYLFIANIFYKVNKRKKTLMYWKMFKKNMELIDGDYNLAIAYMHGLPTYYLVDCVKSKHKIGWVHNDYSSIGPIKSEYYYFNQLDKTVTISQVCVRSLQKYFKKLNNIINIPNFSSSTIINELSNKENPYPKIAPHGSILLSIGRLHHQKGFDIAIKAAHKMKEKGINFTWYILGSGEKKDSLLDMIKFYSLENYFVLLGTTSNPYPYIKNASLIIQTSRFEGKSIVLDEAKILNKVIIATKYNSVEDQIQDGVNGVLCDINPDSIALKIEEMLNNTKLFNNIIQNLKNSVSNEKIAIEKFENMVSEYE